MRVRVRVEPKFHRVEPRFQQVVAHEDERGRARPDVQRLANGLTVIAVVLTVTIVASLRADKREDADAGET